MYYLSEIKKTINPYVPLITQTVQQVSQKAIEVQQKYAPQQYIDYMKPQYLYQIYDRIHYMPQPKDEKFNLISENLNKLYGEYTMPSELFNDQVNECNIVGFPCPTLKLIFAICKQIITWLKGDCLNQAIVTCQASLGRSVLLISCLLCLMKQYSHPGEAVSHISSILKAQESQILFATHRLYIQYFINVKNGIKLNLKKIQIQKILINGIPINQNKDEQIFAPYLQIFDEKDVLYNSLKKAKEEKLNCYTLNDSGICFEVNLEIESEQDILIRVKHYQNKSTRYPVFRVLFNSGFVFDEVVRFRSNDVEFSPFYDPDDDFFIDLTVKFLDQERPQSELQLTYQNIEDTHDKKIDNIMTKGINTQITNNQDFSIESEEDHKINQEIKQQLNIDEYDKRVSLNSDDLQKKVSLGNSDDLDEYFNQLEND